MFNALFSPIRIGNVKLKNRIIAAPTSPHLLTTDGLFTPEMIAYLEEKAKGGAAVVTYGEAIVHSATGKSHNKQLQLDSPGVKLGLMQATDRIHNAGALANIELSHGGMYAGLASVGGSEDLKEIAYGPSDLDLPEGHVTEMPKEIIYEIIEAYGRGAAICKKCGFDMVMVHAAHGWLFSQFLSPYYNRRTDEFGGSLENRARFYMLTLDAVRKAVGPGFPIEARIAGDDLTDKGLNMNDCIKVAKLIEDKVDLYNISCGCHEDPALFCRTHPNSFHPKGVNVYLAAEMKKHVSKPVSCVGAVWFPEQMEEILTSGQADLIEIARGLIADPELPNKARKGQEKDITPCLACYECFSSNIDTEVIKCTVNPVIGYELQHKEYLPPADTVKNVLIAGGGPAGMEAAITAAARGHKVTLVEKSDKLGGNLYAAGAPYFKKDILKLCEVLKNRVSRANVEVILNTEVTEEFIKEFNPDALIVAIGSDEFKLPVEGTDLPNVIMAIDAELHPEKLGHRVAIMGGGLVGAEAAVSFAKEGHECSIIEMKDAIAEEVNFLYRGGLMPHVEESAKIYTNAKIKKIVAEGVIAEKDGKEILIEADSVVCAVGFKTPWAKVDSLCDLVQESYTIGDCNKVAKIREAMNSAYYTARRL